METIKGPAAQGSDTCPKCEGAGGWCNFCGEAKCDCPGEGGYSNWRLCDACRPEERAAPAAQAERPQAVVFAEGMRQAAAVIGERLRLDFGRIYAEEAPTMTEHERLLARKFVDSIEALARETASQQPRAAPSAIASDSTAPDNEGDDP